MKKTLTIIFFLAIYFSVNAEISKIRMKFNENTSTSVTLAWVQESGKSPVVCFDTDKGLAADNQLTFVQQPQQNWKYLRMQHYFVRFDDLLPETVYYFQIVDSEGSSEQ